jgi:signal transduction histidine kinase
MFRCHSSRPESRVLAGPGLLESAIGNRLLNALDATLRLVVVIETYRSPKDPRNAAIDDD